MSGISRILREALRKLLARRTGGEVPMDMAELGRAVSGGLDESSADFLAMMGRDGPMPTPEEALGRPLTPDHIWNDPRFKHRLAMTSDLEGKTAPVDRFRIAGERAEANMPRNEGNDLDRWRGDRSAMLDDLIRRERSIDGSYGGAPVDRPMTMGSIIDMGTDPRLAPHYDEFAQGYLGHFGVGGSAQHAPLLGAALTAGAGGGLTLRELLARRYGERT